MAAVSRAAVHPLGPPGTAPDVRETWDFAVPASDENPLLQDLSSSPDTSFNNTSYPAPQPLTQQTNGNIRSHQPRKNTIDSQRSSKSGWSNRRSLNAYSMQGGQKRKVSATIRRPNPEEDEDNWIHRDKLAQIESKELEEAGFQVGGRMSRSVSRTASRTTSTSTDRRDRSADRYAEGVNGHESTSTNGYSTQDEKRQRRVSPIPAEDEAEEFDFESRSQEELAAERGPPTPGRQQAMRPGTGTSRTRIPVSRLPKMSPNPDAPGAQGQSGSKSWGDLNKEYKSRARSGSVGSAILLDDEPGTPTNGGSMSDSASPQGSPPKPKSNKKTTGGTRKTSRVTSGAKSRKPSGPSGPTGPTGPTSPTKRPGTSGGTPRPSTSHRPEGDPPWINNMYKPDPRLPPDQQILPTHAKRMAQEQWEKEGKTGSMYDKEFRLLNTEELAPPESYRNSIRRSISPIPPPSESPKDEKPEKIQWPLPSPKAESFNLQLTRPGTSGSNHGGYSTIPAIRTPPPLSPRSPVGSIPRNHRKSPRAEQQSPIRVQEPPEDEKRKKSCGCCAVM